MDINVRYYQRFHIWFLPIAVLLDNILPATTAHKQKHRTHTNSIHGSSIGEVKI
jgi:hypothetical protein